MSDRIVKVCCGTGCLANGSKKVLEALRAEIEKKYANINELDKEIAEIEKEQPKIANSLFDVTVNKKILNDLRAKIKEFLNRAEDENPGIKEKVMSSFQKDLGFDSPIPTTLNECEICGEPTSGKICKACEIKDLLNNI